MLDVFIDLARPDFSPKGSAGKVNSTTKLDTESPAGEVLEPTNDAQSEATSHVRTALNFLAQHVSQMLHDRLAGRDARFLRKRLAGILPVGVGAAPFPDFQEAQGADAFGIPQGSLVWNSIAVIGENCDGNLDGQVARENQIIVIKRGGCSFSQKLENIPHFPRSSISLQMVIIVSFDEGHDPEGNSPVRPLLDAVQKALGGFPRPQPIPMVLVGGGEAVYEAFRRAIGVGIRRRYSIEAQGIPISNLVIF